ncbi:MAG: electron transfer flavoprotein subunit beta/FixA family protein [Oligoflexia bacterium]|nr:electron transfer flavoprotein subunit beta/FixA family protein [Oligoflexia bacterium]
MCLKIIVTVKQVPDTHNITGDAMKADGTVNRALLPAIFNPEDLNALEEALKIKENIRVGTSASASITVVTMGPPKAVEVLKESLYRGVDDVVLVSDSKFAGADTLATSYVLSLAIKKLGHFDLIICGRQAIDGDTAQVGPQLAEKLNINQITNVEEILEITNGSAATTATTTATTTFKVKRATENGYEILKSKFPLLLTVTATANSPRPASAKKVMIYKNFSIKESELSYLSNAADTKEDKHNECKVWNVNDIGADINLCGVSGSPTKVKSIQNVVLTVSESKQIANTNENICELVRELTREHILS